MLMESRNLGQRSDFRFQTRGDIGLQITSVHISKSFLLLHKRDICARELHTGRLCLETVHTGLYTKRGEM
jgi:hypothetical protein